MTCDAALPLAVIEYLPHPDSQAANGFGKDVRLKAGHLRGSVMKYGNRRPRELQVGRDGEQREFAASVGRIEPAAHYQYPNTTPPDVHAQVHSDRNPATLPARLATAN